MNLEFKSVVILSEVSVSRSEADTQSKDPAVAGFATADAGSSNFFL
jgi:hypothetical protein